MRRQQEVVPQVEEGVPSHVQAKFFGVAAHEQDKWAQGEQLNDSILQFYGDGSGLRGQQRAGGETLDQAASKFHGSGPN
eukprot:CAMPEP_0205815516 /NCGR_PEP_ID=MMETSP0205-20121125/21331_1 /ASSEMBLY_ACC=CAM_ASM_000278 /TAXON_ID=36767 /ORGANISM="Euplotes focardii, Strain TN1" /LENGTH=78 /DNA_ID=CAMNT_0053101995 /DNA_START=167 /DNA_END=400 /DNA_ORIENTATION=+